jgi:hypothetical protein
LRKLIGLLVCIALMSLLFGCAKIKPTDVSEEVIYEKNYEIGIEKSVFVGESVIKVVDYSVFRKKNKMVKANADFTISTSGWSYRAKKGETFKLWGTLEGDNGPQDIIEIPDMGLFSINSNGTIDRQLGGGNRKLSTRPKVNPNNATLEVVFEDIINATRGYVNYEIIFTGISEKNITLLYREFTSEGLARVAFYQNLTYPIDSKTIRHKNTLISVTGVTPEKLNYIVVVAQCGTTHGASHFALKRNAMNPVSPRCLPG